MVKESYKKRELEPHALSNLVGVKVEVGVRFQKVIFQIPATFKESQSHRKKTGFLKIQIRIMGQFSRIFFGF